MIKSGLALAAAAFAVSPYGPFPIAGNDATNGRWTAEVRERGCDQERATDRLCLQLRIERGSTFNNSSWSFPIAGSELVGLTIKRDLDLEEAHFELKRPAGTFSFEGSFANGRGKGEFVFLNDPEYLAAVKRLGFGQPSEVEVMTLAAHAVSQRTLGDFARLGYAKDGIDAVIGFGIHGVEPEFVDKLTSLGYDRPTADELVSLRIHGVTTEFVREMQRERAQRPSIDDLVSMRIHGVDRDLTRKLAALDVDEFDEGDLVSLKIHGVDLGLVEALRGIDTDPDVDDLVGLQIQGVTPEFIRRMAAAGLEDLDVDDLVSAKIQGVDPDFIRDMVGSGLDDLDLEDLIGARIQGLSADYVREMIGAGLRDLDLDDYIGLKVNGVDGDFVRRHLREDPDADADDVVDSWVTRHHPRRNRHRPL